MASDEEVLEAFAKNGAYILKLERQRDGLRSAILQLVEGDNSEDPCWCDFDEKEASRDECNAQYIVKHSIWCRRSKKAVADSLEGAEDG